MIWTYIEYLTTVIEYTIYSDFMIRFLKTKDKYNKIVCFIVIIILNSVLTLIFNRFMTFEGVLGLFRVSMNIALAFLLLKGTVFEKVFVAFICDIFVLFINFLTMNILGGILNMSVMDLANERGQVRLLLLFITKFLFFMATRVMLSVRGHNEYRFSTIEWTAISLIFITTMFVGLNVFKSSLENGEVYSSLSSISTGLGLILINIINYVLMILLSKKNNERTELLLYKMQADLYESQLRESEIQFEEIKKIRHDMKNHLLCIEALISEHDLNGAEQYINDMIRNKLNFGYQSIRTGNRVVDIVANTKLLKCREEGIKTVVKIMAFPINISDTDICVLLGNLFDNAIEECMGIQGEREICFEFLNKKSYVNIKIKNSLKSSILRQNPELNTTKKDKNLHGIGLRSIRDVVNKYEGMIDFYEEGTYFIVDVWLKNLKS